MKALAWLGIALLCLAVAWLWPRVGLWWRYREAAKLWQAREDMEAALWAECTAGAAGNAAICNKVESPAE